jgi:expansin (peptidoglycan-binding protein)
MKNILVITFTLLSTIFAADLLTAFSTKQTGDGTYYGGTTGGNCGYGTLIPSFASSLTLVAMNKDQYIGASQSQGCGMCVSMRGTGSGSGANPVSTSYFTAFVTDQCPECLTGSIDIGKSGDGRWGVEWTAVNCPVGSETLRYKFEGSNDWYLKVQVVGGRIPISSVEFNVGGNYYLASRTQDNFWESTGSMPKPFSWPLTVRITPISGSAVIDAIPYRSDAVLIQGSKYVQFASIGSSTPSSSSSSSSTSSTSSTSSSSSSSSGTSTASCSWLSQTEWWLEFNGDPSGSGYITCGDTRTNCVYQWGKWTCAPSSRCTGTTKAYLYNTCCSCSGSATVDESDEAPEATETSQVENSESSLEPIYYLPIGAAIGFVIGAFLAGLVVILRKARD